MAELHDLFEEMVSQLPRLVLEKRLADKVKEAGLPVNKAMLSKMADHILSGNTQNFTFGESDGAINIHITDDDLEQVLAQTNRFIDEQMAGALAKAGEDVAQLVLKSLRTNWPAEFEAQHVDMTLFKERLEHRWGKALGKLRMLLTIVREWAQGAHERTLGVTGGRLSHLQDVMLRLHVRACQVTGEIIVLLENGYSDGAMARWRTLHEVTIVAAVVATFGEEIAERYVHYQIVESFRALKTYEQTHKSLGFKPPSKKLVAQVTRDYGKVLQRFGKKFGEEHGWAAHHLKTKEKERITFARLEEEAGDAMMRSPYKMASYNVHASPKGVYFKLGNLDGSPALLAGASNAGLIEPAQNAAVSLAEITLLIIGDSPVFDDIVAANIIVRLEGEIPREFAKADRLLRRDDRQHRKPVSTGSTM